MGLVRGRDAAVGVEHNDGIAADSTVGTYAPYPLITFDHKIDALPLEEPDELLAQGARETVPPSQKQIIGTMVLRPRFDDEAFLKILCNAMGGTETRVADTSVLGLTATGVNVHVIEAGGLQPRQWLRVNLGTAGLRIDSTCKFSKMVWEHSARSMPKVSIDVLGISPTTGVGAALGDHNGTDPLKATSLETDSWSWLMWRPSPGDSNWVTLPKITSCKITLDHQMEQVGTYVDSPSSFSELGAGEKTRIVEVELEGEMEDGLDSTEDHPYYSYVNGTAFGLDLCYGSAVVATGSQQRQMRLHLPNITPVDGSEAVAGPGVLKWTVKAIAEQSTEFMAQDQDTPAAGIDFRMLFTVTTADEDANNTGSYFCHQHA
jgi:hypothetical protein